PDHADAQGVVRAQHSRGGQSSDSSGNDETTTVHLVWHVPHLNRSASTCLATLSPLLTRAFVGAQHASPVLATTSTENNCHTLIPERSCKSPSSLVSSKMMSLNHQKNTSRCSCCCVCCGRASSGAGRLIT